MTDFSICHFNVKRKRAADRRVEDVHAGPAEHLLGNDSRGLCRAQSNQRPTEFINQKAPWFPKRLLDFKNLGGVLLSHAVPHAVPSALKSLTAVFGMGTGVSSSPLPPKTG